MVTMDAAISLHYAASFNIIIAGSMIEGVAGRGCGGGGGGGGLGRVGCSGNPA